MVAMPGDPVPAGNRGGRPASRACKVAVSEYTSAATVGSTPRKLSGGA
jgi:hypothetical protein